MNYVNHDLLCSVDANNLPHIVERKELDFFWRSYVRMIYFLYIFDSMFCYCFVLSGWASFTFFYIRVRQHQFIVDLTFCLCFIFISKIFCYRLLLGIDLVIFVYLYMSCIYISC